VIIVDDHELARAGLAKLLTGASDLELVGEAPNGHEAVGLCRRMRPDLVIMDVRLPDMDGLKATRLIRQALPDCRVLLFTMYEAADYLLEAVRAGASGYVLKGGTRRDLLQAVREALSAPVTTPEREGQPDTDGL
jgi:DNA-binding NarL/FixJ family response regulator